MLAKTEGTRLEAIGIKGLILDHTTGFQTWAQIASRFEERAAALRKRLEESERNRAAN